MGSDVNLKAIVLAAGKGTRLQTGDGDSPKVMRPVCGRSLLWYVLDALSFIEKRDIAIVVGYKKDDVIDHFPGYTYAEQTEQLGTGHAVMAAREVLAGFNGAVLVCYGDMPAIRRDTYEALVKTHFRENNECTILTSEAKFTQGGPKIPLEYGRVVRGRDGGFLQVVEDRDCTPEQRLITELNSGVYTFNAQPLLEALKHLNNDNTQNEYYLTDVPAILLAGGARVGILRRDMGDEILGVNTLAQLEQAEEIMHGRSYPSFLHALTFL